MDSVKRIFPSTIALIGLLIVAASCSDSEDDIIEVTPIPETFSIAEVAFTPTDIAESSGLMRNSNELWTINDSGSDATVYQLDTAGNILTENTFDNLNNTDWEAIYQDSGFVYIGDFGNNAGDRQDLTIYKIRTSELVDPTASPEIITYSFLDQTDFTNNPQNTPYDVEAMVVIDDLIYLFTKDWTALTTTIYTLPNISGDYVLDKIATLDTGCLITDATLSSTTSQVILVGYDSQLIPYLITVDLNGMNPALLDRKQLLEEGSQMEGIAFFDSEGQKDIFYATSETINLNLGGSTINIPGKLFRIEISR
jgi:hypothetical protein